MLKELYYSDAVKTAVAEIDEMFLNTTNFVSCQKGIDTTLSECLSVLEKHKEVLPLHVFRVLKHVLVTFAGEELPEGESVCLEEILTHIAIFREVHEYRRIAEERVREDYVDFFPKNMVFEEIYALVYERYLADVLKAW